MIKLRDFELDLVHCVSFCFLIIIWCFISLSATLLILSSFKQRLEKKKPCYRLVTKVFVHHAEHCKILKILLLLWSVENIKIFVINDRKFRVSKQHPLPQCLFIVLSLNLLFIIIFLIFVFVENQLN